MPLGQPGVHGGPLGGRRAAGEQGHPRADGRPRGVAGSGTDEPLDQASRPRWRAARPAPRSGPSARPGGRPRRRSAVAATATTVLPEPDVALEQPVHGQRAGQVGADAATARRWAPVRRERQAGRGTARPGSGPVGAATWRGGCPGVRAGAAGGAAPGPAAGGTARRRPGGGGPAPPGPSGRAVDAGEGRRCGRPGRAAAAIGPAAGRRTRRPGRSASWTSRPMPGRGERALSVSG